MDRLSIEKNSASVAAFARDVRNFALRTKPWQTAIRYQTKPDERRDLTLVSMRCYGRRDEFMAVRAAAGLESIEDELTEQLLVLPTEAQLTEIKARSGFVNRAGQRRG